MNGKNAACFWCTYEFDNNACYIPKNEDDIKIDGYGSFCRPECAVAFLFNESIDDSIKFTHKIISLVPKSIWQSL